LHGYLHAPGTASLTLQLTGTEPGLLADGEPPARDSTCLPKFSLVFWSTMATGAATARATPFPTADAVNIIQFYKQGIRTEAQLLIMARTSAIS
jgi:hypothetical protein